MLLSRGVEGPARRSPSNHRTMAVRLVLSPAEQLEDESVASVKQLTRVRSTLVAERTRVLLRSGAGDGKSKRVANGRRAGEVSDPGDAPDGASDDSNLGWRSARRHGHDCRAWARIQAGRPRSEQRGPLRRGCRWAAHRSPRC